MEASGLPAAPTPPPPTKAVGAEGANCANDSGEPGTAVSGLRFTVGERVQCKTSATSWKKGCIVALNYREESWPVSRVAPYQIQLDTGVLIFAPQDDGHLIKADNGTEDLDVKAEIHVCQAGPCRRAGGEAVLVEIEELSNSVGGVVVQPSGCLGNCSQAPNALLESGGSERIFARLCTLSDTAEVVKVASGRAPSLDDADMVARLDRARRLRMRMEAREESKWNRALSGLAEDVERAKSEEDRAELLQEHVELLAAAGFGDKALSVLSAAGTVDDVRLDDIPTLRLVLDQAKILARLGRVADLEAWRTRVDQLQPSSPRERKIKAQVVDMLVEMIVGVPVDQVTATHPHPHPHRSPLASRLSPITDHRSPITDHRSPLTAHRSPSPFLTRPSAPPPCSPTGL